MASYSIIKKIVVVCTFAAIVVVLIHGLNILINNRLVFFQREATLSEPKATHSNTALQNIITDNKAIFPEFQIQDTQATGTASQTQFTEPINTASTDEDLPHISTPHSKDQITETRIATLSPIPDSHRKTDERMVFASKLLERLKAAQVNVAPLEARLHTSKDLDSLLIEIKSLWASVEEKQKKHMEDSKKQENPLPAVTENNPSHDKDNHSDPSKGKPTDNTDKNIKPDQSEEKDNNGVSEDKKPNTPERSPAPAQEDKKEQQPEKDNNGNKDKNP
jgi:hypothetical protein